MRKKLFLLGSTLSFSLLTRVAFDTVSCNRKTETVFTSNEDTEKIIKQKTFEIKQKVKSLIDDYTTNSENEENKEWIINIHDKSIIEKLKKAVNNLSSTNQSEMLSSISSELDEKVKVKINQLQNYVNKKIINDEYMNLPTDFQITINNDFESFLTDFKIANFVDILKKLLNAKNSFNPVKKTNFIQNTYLNFLTTNNNWFISDEDITSDNYEKPDIFKINTDFTYSFNYAGISEIDEYKECELLVTEDVNKANGLKLYANQQIKNQFDNLLSDQLQIYGDFSINNFENLNNKLNWDFTDKDVKSEIIEARIQAIKKMMNDESDAVLFKALVIAYDSIEFELLDNMNFSNEKIKKPLTKTKENTVNLVYGNKEKLDLTPFSSIKNELLKQLGIKEREKGSAVIEKYYFNKNVKNQFWDGGEVSKDYADNLAKNGKDKEFYNQGNYLIAYGNLLISRLTFAGLRLSPLTIKTNIVIEETAFSEMVENLFKYLEGLISVLQNSTEPNKPGFKDIGADEKLYWIQWKFYDKEWDEIEKEMARNNDQISFNWIVENIIYVQQVYVTTQLIKTRNQLARF